MLTDDQGDVITTAMRLLKRRDHARYELTQKLMARGFALTDITPALDKLVERRYLSEARYTESLIRVRQARGIGPLRIKAELCAKRIPDILIAEHLQINDNGWFDIAKKVLAKQFKARPPKDAEERLKYKRFLQQRGFTNEQISTVCRVD